MKELLDPDALKPLMPPPVPGWIHWSSWSCCLPPPRRSHNPWHVHSPYGTAPPINWVETIAHLTQPFGGHHVEGAGDEGKDERMAGHGGPSISFTFAKYGKKVYISCLLNWKWFIVYYKAVKAMWIFKLAIHKPKHAHTRAKKTCWTSTFQDLIRFHR